MIVYLRIIYDYTVTFLTDKLTVITVSVVYRIRVKHGSFERIVALNNDLTQSNFVYIAVKLEYSLMMGASFLG